MGFFHKSRPVWADGLEREINVTCGFYAKVERKSEKQYFMKLAASSFYRLFLNGKFVYYGPARCAHGYYRVDEIDLTGQLKDGENDLAIEVVGYNVNSFYSLDQPSFLQAELFEDGKTIAATGEDGNFIGFVLKQRRRKIQRFSFQRAIGESYLLQPGADAWRCGDFSEQTQIQLVSTEDKQMVARGIPLNHFTKVVPEKVLSRGRVHTGVIPKSYKKDRSLTNISEQLKGFPEQELELHLSDEVQEMEYFDRQQVGDLYAGTSLLHENTFEIVSLPSEKTGFIGMDIHCKEDGTLYIMVDETLINQDVDPLSMECLNVIRLDIKAGDYSFLSFETFGFGFLKLVCTTGEMTVHDIHLLESRYPAQIISSYHGDNTKLAAIYDAAIETFCQNAPDIFMDCPTRERAGWLCDSFFTARVEHLFTGENRMEKGFLENFLLAEKFKCIPEGMLPMCYPADQYDGNFIPNWAMWFVIELGDYLKRTGDQEFVSLLHDKVYALLDYFVPFENEYGLLEKLENWVFVEWSKANELVQDVNFPTNMLYAATLKTAGELYHDSALIEKSAYLADVIRNRSFDGSYFVDNELRTENGLRATGERTETCQYYAFFFDIAKPEQYPELWRVLTEEFGPDRVKKGMHPDIYPANAFVGNYLRLDVLTRYGLKERCLQEIEGYFYYMAEKTGTLWENITDYASCNHGFASYAAYLIDKNI